MTTYYNGNIRTYRSVNDFGDNTDDLRLALTNMSIQTREDIENERERVEGSSSARNETMEVERTDASRERIDSAERLDNSWDWTLTDYDEERSDPQSIDHEVKRLQNVTSFQMMESEQDPTAVSTYAMLHRLAVMGQRLLGVAICNVNMMDIGRTYIMSGVGAGDIKETARKETWCNHTMQYKDKLMVVPDATKDWRFRHSPHVTGPFHLRFYASTPLVSPEGYRLGSFCGMGCEAKPHGLSAEETATFLDLGILATQALIGRRELLRSHMAMESAQRRVEVASHDETGLLNCMRYCMQPLLDDIHDPQVILRFKQNLTTALLAADTVRYINEKTLKEVKEEAAKPTGVVMADGNRAQETVNMREDLVRLMHLIDPIPKKNPIVLSVDQRTPHCVMTRDAQKLQLACLAMLRHASAKPKGEGPIQFRIAPQNNQVVFFCRQTMSHSNVDTNSYTLRPDISTLLPPLTSHQHHDKEPVDNLGLRSLAAHVHDLGGSFGYQRPTDEGGSQETGTYSWFSIPLEVAPLSQQPDVSSPPNKRSISSDSPWLPVVRITPSNGPFSPGANEAICSLPESPGNLMSPTLPTRHSQAQNYRGVGQLLDCQDSNSSTPLASQPGELKEVVAMEIGRKRIKLADTTATTYRGIHASDSDRMT
jgi:hypothetical protein